MYIRIVKNGKKALSSGFLFSLLALSLVLGGCQGIGTQNTTQTSAPLSPAEIINTTMQAQGSTRLQTFQDWIGLMRQYGGDTRTYQQQFVRDQQALQRARNATTYKVALATLATQTEAIKVPALKSEATMLQQKLQKQASDYENQHPYHDTYNNVTYHMGFEYDTSTGIGSWVQDDLNSAQTLADYQQVIESENIYLTNFQAMQANSGDTTPYNQVHQADMQLLKTYGRTEQKVLVISLAEQAMRVYDHGKLVNAFFVTTGRPEKPSRPGSWWVESHQRNVIFKANLPRSDPYWYPDTPINYAMQYHSDGYFVHDSWWRVEYGPRTQFPHQDVTGDISADLGSHGCVNLSKADAAWVYNFVTLFTGIIIY